MAQDSTMSWNTPMILCSTSCIYIFFNLFGFWLLRLSEKSHKKIPLRRQQKLLFQLNFYVNVKKKKIGSIHLKIHQRRSLNNYAIFMERNSRHQVKIWTLSTFFSLSKKQMTGSAAHSLTTDKKLGGGISQCLLMVSI